MSLQSSTEQNSCYTTFNNNTVVVTNFIHEFLTKMSSKSSPVSDTLVVVSVCSVLLTVCTTFALIFATEDAEHFRKCVQREKTSADECALIIYGR